MPLQRSSLTAYSAYVVLVIAACCWKATLCFQGPAQRQRKPVRLRTENTPLLGTNLDSDDSSDTRADLPSPGTTAPTSPATDSLMFLHTLGAITGRGEFATSQQHQAALPVIETLERRNATPQASLDDAMIGTWELVYTNTQLFRTSPFFQAGRAVCTTEQQQAQFAWFCNLHRKALAISNIRAVRQIISRTGPEQGRLVNELEISAGAIPFWHDVTPWAYSGGLPVTIDGAIVSSADWSSVQNGTAWELYMDTVQIRGSNVPGLRQLLDQNAVRLNSRQLADTLERTISTYKTPRPVFRHTYMDEMFRIGRDLDNNVFCFVKTSTSTATTDYQHVDSDLGLLKLLEGFNDAVTRYYL